MENRWPAVEARAVSDRQASWLAPGLGRLSPHFGGLWEV